MNKSVEKYFFILYNNHEKYKSICHNMEGIIMAETKTAASALKTAAAEAPKTEAKVEAPKAEAKAEAPKKAAAPKKAPAKKAAAPKKETAKKAPAKKEAAPKKEAAKKPVEKKAAEAATKVAATATKAKAAVKATASKTKKAVKTAVKKAVVKEAVVQYNETSYRMDDIVKMCEKDCKAKNKKVAITDIKVYVKPQDGKAYYTANDASIIGDIQL